MKINEAISRKIKKICIEEGISVNKLANICCLTQSTVEHLVNGESKNPKILTIVRICDGLNIKIKDFFSDELFEDIDRED